MESFLSDTLLFDVIVVLNIATFFAGKVLNHNTNLILLGK